jgi:hypothetical protein
MIKCNSKVKNNNNVQTTLSVDSVHAPIIILLSATALGHEIRFVPVKEGHSLGLIP